MFPEAGARGKEQGDSECVQNGRTLAVLPSSLCGLREGFVPLGLFSLIVGMVIMLKNVY